MLTVTVFTERLKIQVGLVSAILKAIHLRIQMFTQVSHTHTQSDVLIKMVILQVISITARASLL